MNVGYTPNESGFTTTLPTIKNLYLKNAFPAVCEGECITKHYVKTQRIEVVLRYTTGAWKNYH
jgi:hypothetical protein